MKAIHHTYTKDHLVLYINDNYKAEYDQSGKSDYDYFEEIDYNQVKGFDFSRIPFGRILVCDMHRQTLYEHLEFVEISSSNGLLCVSAEVNFRFSQWPNEISLVSFVEDLRKRMTNIHRISSEQENLFDEDLLHLKFRLKGSKGDSVSSLINRLAVLIAYEHCDVYESSYKKIQADTPTLAIVHELDLDREHLA